MSLTKILKFLPGSDSFLATTHDNLLQCSLTTWSAAPKPQVHLSSIARRIDGHCYGVSRDGSTLYHLDVDTGTTTRMGKLSLGQHTGNYSGDIRHVRGLSFSDQPNELWGILPCKTLKHQNTDCMVLIDEYTGEIKSIHRLNRCDVLAIAVPPRAGGSWRGVTHFFWCHTGGLYSLKNANEGYKLNRIGAPTDGKQIRDICFSRNGTLYGIGSSGLCTVQTEMGAIKKVLNFNNDASESRFESLLWLPFDPSKTAAPNPSVVASRMQSFQDDEGKYNLLGALGVDLNYVLPSKQRRTSYGKLSRRQQSKVHGVDRKEITKFGIGRNRRASYGKMSKRQKIRVTSQNIADKAATDKAIWIEVVVDGGNNYFYHRFTRATSWTNPEKVVQEDIPPPPPSTTTKLSSFKNPQEFQRLENDPEEEQDDLLFFLQDIGMEMYFSSFQYESLSLKQLMSIARQSRTVLDGVLKEIGIKKLGSRMKIYIALLDY